MHKYINTQSIAKSQLINITQSNQKMNYNYSKQIYSQSSYKQSLTKMSSFEQHNPEMSLSQNFPQLNLKSMISNTSNASHLHIPGGHSYHSENLAVKKNQSKTPEQVFQQSRKILKKTPEIRSPADNQVLLQLAEHNKFLGDLVQNISLECFKGLMKQAKIEEVRQRQLLCQQGKPITHIVILLDGKLGLCKQEDDFLQQQQGQTSQGNRTPVTKSMVKSSNTNLSQSSSPNKQNKEKQTRTIGTITPMDNVFDQLTALSCKQIENIRKKNNLLKRKSSVPITAGLFLPMPFSHEEYEQLQIENYVFPGQEYGAKLRSRSKFYTNTGVAVEKSLLLIIEFNSLVYWFQHAFRAKLGQTIQKLKKIPAFSFLQDGKLAECILFMKKQKKKRNQFIYKQGSKSQKLYILIHGQIKLTKQAKLFEQNPNQLYMDRRKLLHQSTDLKNGGAEQQKQKKVDLLHYANLKTLYNYRPMKKNIQIGIISSSNLGNFNLFGQTQMLQKRTRQTNAIVSSFECQFYQMDVKKLQQILGSKFIQQFYHLMQRSLRRIILYRQNEYAQKVNLQNRQNLDYFYYENDKTKDSPRKYKLEKINNKFNAPVSDLGNKIHLRSSSIGNNNNNQIQDDTIKPYYTTFNFHKLMKTQRLSSHTRKSSRNSSRDKGKNQPNKRKMSQDSQQNIKIKFNPMQQRLIGISHTWKPIKKKVIQEIKVMQKISSKRHDININQPLIQQQYFYHVQKQQKRIDRQHKIFKLSLGKRTKW